MRRTGLIRLYLLVGAILAGAAFQQLESSPLGHSIRASLVLGVMAISGLACLALLWLSRSSRLEVIFGGLRRLRGLLARLGPLNLLGLALFSLVGPAVVYWGQLNPIFPGVNPRMWLVWLLAVLGALMFQALRPKTPYFEALAAVLLIDATVLLLAGELGVGAVSNTSYTMGWSEGSRYYYASQFFAPLVYGTPLPLPTLHPTRYFLQGLAFLIPNASIALHRLWQAILWFGASGLAAWALARRVSRLAAGGGGDLPWQGLSQLWPWLAGGWAFVFFFVGPIYYHLVLCAVPVLLAFDRRRFGRSLLVVVAASVWAGLSRINWYPVPGALALLLYLLEEPQGSRRLWRYLLPPAAWALVGTGVAFLVSQVYMAVSGNPPEVFGSALSSPLLWYRLFPNATYGPGILWGAAAAFGPALALLAACLLPQLQRWRIIRLLGIAGVLAAFLTAGLVVSAKIGGGADLHNLDNFVLFLAVTVIYFASRRFQPDELPASAPRRSPGMVPDSRPDPAPPPAPAALVALGLLVLLLAVANAAFDLVPPIAPRLTPAAEAMENANLQYVLDLYKDKGPVLFITQRQLLAFHNLDVTSFEPEYEKVFLMEMVMANNQAYLGRFERDLQAHKFGLVITEPLANGLQDLNRSFSEENNAWIERVEFPLLANYQRIASFSGAQVDVYAPR